MSESCVWKQGFPLSTNLADIPMMAENDARAYYLGLGYTSLTATLREIRNLQTEYLAVLDCVREGTENPPPTLGG